MTGENLGVSSSKRNYNLSLDAGAESDRALAPARQAGRGRAFPVIEGIHGIDMRFQFIVCKVLQREAYLCASRSIHVVDVVVMPQGLHNQPDRLRDEVQKALTRMADAHGRPYDASLLGYGLCSNGVAGIQCGIPLVIPRAHDCITLLLGSKESYKQYFDTHQGIYWYSAGWIENNLQPGRERREQTYREYFEKYGEDNAEYLMEMEQTWMKEYSWATYIDWELPASADYRKYTRECADYLCWNFDEVKGKSGLLMKLVNGEWDENEFLVVQPGRKIAPDVNNPGIIKAE